MALIPPKLILPLAIGLVAATVVLMNRKGGEADSAQRAASTAGAVAVAQQQAPAQPMAPAGDGAPMGAMVADVLPIDPLPPNYIPRNLRLFEGHWQGMDGRLMTEELARKLRYPRGLQGILLGEVTLNAAYSGFLGGDVIVKVEGAPVPTIEAWQRVSRELANRTEARVTILRREGGIGAAGETIRATKATRNARIQFEGGASTVMRTMTLVLRAQDTLGFVQVESAPMILPGDPRPHSDRGPCTECHPIGKGLELAPDPDLISLPPPVISQRQAAKANPPHENRGPCEACHVIQ